MSCHESLMARRRKKSKAAAAQAKAKEKEVQIEKSLPALPPNEIALQSTFSPERSTFESDRSTLSPTPRVQQPPTNDSSRSSSRRAASPERGGDKDGLTLPNTTYRNNRHSVISQESDLNGLGDDGFYIPLALDPSPAPQFAPRSTSHNMRADLVKNKENTSKDYFNTARGSGRTQGTATPSSQVSTPHIAFQANGRTVSSDHIETGTDSPRRPAPSSRSASSHASPAIASDEPKRHLAEAMKSAYANDRGQTASDQFRLQEVPRRKKSSDSRGSSSQENNETGSDKSRHIAGSQAPAQPPRRDISSNFPRTDSSDSGLHRRDGSYLSLDKVGTPRSSAESRFRHDSDSTPSSENAPTLPIREALPRNESSKSIPRKEVGGSNHKPSASLAKLEALTSPKPALDAAPTVNGKEISPPILGSQTLQRPAPPQQKLSDTYMAPREPPAPPAPRRSAKETSGSTAGEVPSTELPRWSAGGDFTMDEDMARILGADEGSQSILRRVSNAVRHGRAGSEASTGGRHGHVRSISETTTRQIGSPNWPKTPIVEDEQSGHTRQISSPISGSSRADDPAFLRRQLRDSELRVAELEKQFTTTKDLSKMNKQLVEKRKTVSELGSQAELMIRQIEAFAGYVEKARNAKGELDLQDMEDSAIKEFVQKVERLKDSLSRDLEVLFVEREQLMDEKDQAIKARDRALIEFEQLSSKNAQLADMNNDLTTQIQERFKAQSGANTEPKPNGLGIYHSKDKSSVHLDDASMNSGTTIYGSSATAVGTYPQPMDIEGDSQVFAAPQVVQIRKLPGKKFNWGKKGATVAKGVTKGFKGAFYSEKNEKNPQQWQEQSAGDNIGMPYNMTKAAVDSPQQTPPTLPPRHASNDPGRFGLFKKSHNNGSKNQSMGDLSAIAATGPQTLFGSDLSERADFEGSQIPRVVIKCIQEVEIRGMDVEGIYRKTGGSGLTKQLQEGFEKSEDYDISDPDIDITAITSALKQYFRKLPVPLLTFDVYDRVLQAMSTSLPSPIPPATY